MRILFIIHEFLPRYQGGSEIYLYRLAKALQERGHKTYVYTYGDFDEETVFNGIEVKRVSHNHKRRWIKYTTKIKKLLSLLPRLRDEFIEIDFKNQLRLKKPDIVHIHHLINLSPRIIEIVKKAGIPLVITLHDYWFMCYKAQLIKPSFKKCKGPLFLGLNCPFCLTPRPKFFQFIYPFLALIFIYRNLYLRYSLKKADIVTSPSNFLRENFIQYGVSKDRIIHLNYGTNEKLFKNIRPRRKNKIIFAFIGAILPHKGVHVLINAFNKLKTKNVELHIYGDFSSHPERMRYFQILRDLSPVETIEFKGPFNNNEIANILSKIDVLVVPSIWCENSPLVIHEAFMAGVPVIASNIGGIPEMVKDGVNGLLFESGNVGALSAKLKQVIENPSLLNEWRKNIRPIKTIKENVLELERIYRKMLKTSKKK
ncbi:glycosyltransferase family 4 protein [candidate division WOR-3 bacterium]|nr:glycosyltransferase family 4 protein [candidate division WOR-3 bacterium]